MWVSNLKNRHAVSLRKLFSSASFVGCADIHVTVLSDDSKTCTPRCTFAAIPGTTLNGNAFIQEAIANGATSLICDRPLSNVAIPQCVVPHVRSTYAKLCQALFGWPTERLTTVGITGTNGKTTTSYLIRSILKAAHHQAGLLGTIEYNDGQKSEEAKLTTPDAAQFAGWLSRMVQNQTSHAVFELSSHALDQGRVAGVGLDVAIVTNITQDHLDYHQTLKTYRNSKSQILKLCKPNAAVVLNRDDPVAYSLINDISQDSKVITYGFQSDAKIRATIEHESLEETRFSLHLPGETLSVKTPLTGRHNVENCLAAAAACYDIGIKPSQIAEGIHHLAIVPGRLETIDMGQEYQIFVDYAHTDDALRRCLETLKPLTKNKLTCVFGAGGDRDRTKRPLLAIASQVADRIIVTSDNPRTEDPNQIIGDILKGFPPLTTNLHIEPNRKRAIQIAMELAEPGDTLLVAGKGHETYQIIGHTKHEFDDKAVIRTQLNQSLLRIPA